MNKTKLLSVIVPAYEKEKSIVTDLKNIEAVLKQIRYNYEIICVVDGHTDKTFENAKKIKSPKLKVYVYKENHGKGYAVRYGMARSKGDLIAFIDSGMDIDPNGISMLLEHLEWYRADIIIGSKRHPASMVKYPLLRRVYSLIYQMVVKLLFNINVRDTQTGLKLYKREVLEKVLPRMMVKKFAFDIEILAVARLLGFKRIYEAPIRLNPEMFVYSSTISFRSVWEASLDTLAIFYRMNILHYYDDDAKRHWKYDPELKMRINLP